MATPWYNSEVQAFLCLLADDRIQSKLEGATRNEKVFKEVSELMACHGYQRTSKQCREKLKKLKCDYRTIKDLNGKSGSNRRNWKWFDQMDAIYGNRRTSKGRESGLDTATARMESTMDNECLPACDGSSTNLIVDPPSALASAPAPSAASTPARALLQPSTSIAQQPAELGKRKRVLSKDQSFITAMQAEDELNRAQRDQHIRLLLDEAREARDQEAVTRDQEAALRREEIAQNAAFNEAFLGVLGELARAMTHKHV